MTSGEQDKPILPWDARFVWQPLRRATAYRALFAEYEEWAKTEVTGQFAKAFQTLRELKPGFAGIWCVPSMSEPYPEVHRKFLKLYRDVLVFPFPPDIADPPANLISQFVISAPATVDEPAFSLIEEGDNQGAKNAYGAGIIYQSLELNLNHSDKAILSEVELQVQEVLNYYRNKGLAPLFVRADGQNKGWNWDQLQMQMKAWDAYVRLNSDGEHPAFVDICRFANPELIPTENGNPSKEAHSWARQAVTTAEKLIQLFERRPVSESDSI